MSTRYRVSIHCDEVRSTACQGFVADEGTRGFPVRAFELSDRAGWLRGHRGGDTWDVCPVCRPALEAEMAQAREATLEEATS